MNNTINDLKAAGAIDISKEVSFSTIDGSIKARADIVAKMGDTTWIIEVKTTPTAPYTRNQSLVYDLMFNKSPIVPVGNNAKGLFVVGEPTTNYRWITIRFNF